MVAKSAQITTNQVTPFGSFVLVSYEKHEEETTDGGIIIPATEGSQFKIMGGRCHWVTKVWLGAGKAARAQTRIGIRT